MSNKKTEIRVLLVTKEILDQEKKHEDSDKHEKNKKHIQLAQWSEKAHIKARVFLEGLPKDIEMEGIKLGKTRLELKEYLSEEMKEIDQLVMEIMDEEVVTN